MPLSNLFLSATLFVLSFVIWGNAEGTYLEHAQLPLFTTILTEIVLILVNKRLKNPLLDILNLIFIIFFLLRVPFIYGEGLISDINLRNVDISKVKGALYILNFQLIILALCIHYICPAQIFLKKIVIPNNVWFRVLKLSSFVLLVNIVDVALAFKITESNAFVAIFFALFNWGSILLLLVPLLLFANKEDAIKNRLYLYLQLAICVLLVMSTGSKSGLLQIFGLYLVSLLALRGASYKISKKTLIATPIVLIIAVLMFMLGDIFNKVQRSMVELADVYDLFLISLDNITVVLNSVSNRIGYLDYYIDKVTQDVYASAFRLDYYFMAFFNAVTPGFDIFDQTPLVSRAVYNNFFGISDGPNSEVITVFAEAHLLAGYLSFVPYLFVLWVTTLVRKFSTHLTSAYGDAIRTVFICYIFYRYMLGIGIDYWLFGDVVYPFLFIVLSFKFMGLTRTKEVAQFRCS